MKDKKIVVGAVNWDCSLPSDTFFGFHATKSLSPEKYRTVTPFYADIYGSDKIDYHSRSMEEYEREMQYAIDAGIDYFAYCWYGENPKKQATEWQNNLWELSYGRKMHSKSALKEKLKMCAIIGVGAKAQELSEEEMKSLAEEMKQDYYQKIEERPLVYIFDGYKQETGKILKEMCRKCNTPEPYFVYMSNEIDKEEIKEDSDVGAISAYSFPKSAGNYDEFITYLIDDLEKRKKLNLKLIPQFSTGWNPNPRIDNPVPWVGYDNLTYAPQATGEELKKGAERFAKWICDNKECNTTGHILVFAWNEFEEGAHICPTYDKNGKGINTERIDAFREIVKSWKEEL